MVIHHSRCLHERIANRGAAKAKPALLHILAHRIGMLRAHRNLVLALPLIVNGFVTGELPDVFIKSSKLFLDFKKTLSVIDGAVNFELISNDTCIIQELLNFRFLILRDFDIIKIVKSFSEIFSFIQDGTPAQSGLKSIEQNKFKMLMIIMHRNSPFGIMIFHHELRGKTPRTANTFFGHYKTEWTK